MVVAIVMFSLLVQRLFVLQIVKGESYKDNYTLLIERSRDVEATRGNIYDKNGVLLAYNELAYSVTIVDEGNYRSSEQNQTLNKIVKQTIQTIENNGDTIDNEFPVQYADGKYSYTLEGTRLLRFLADIFGHKEIKDLKYDDELGFNQATASPKQIIDYLAGEYKYEVTEKKNERLRYEMVIVRYALAQNFFRKYVPATIATGVSEETVAAICENKDQLTGVKIAEQTTRKYVNSKYFSHIIGYTGKISETEYDTFKKQRNDYTRTDVVGKAGIEQVMETTLQGKKGEENIYVDNLGRVTEVKEHKDAISGNDVYLSIDSDLQMLVYDLLEQEIAGILYSKIQNIKTYNAETEDKIIVPIDDVYFALLNNNVLHLEEFNKTDSSDTEKAIYAAFTGKLSSNLQWIANELSSASSSKYSDLSKDKQEYCTYVYKMLLSQSILISKQIDRTNQTYLDWQNGRISLGSFLQYAISKNWVDIKLLGQNKSEYSDSSEIYQELVKKTSTLLSTDKEYHKLIYKYMIANNELSGKSLCLCLYEQDVLAYNEGEYKALQSGSVSAFDFIREKIRKMEITPSQLALDPCSGSCVITNPQNGELLACVTYPGYDSNKLANGVDAQYFASLNNDLTKPQFNYATQQLTAPGSTFKMVTASAGLTESEIGVTDKIKDLGKFTKVDNEPSCWIYPHGTHGDINVSEALRDSCNYFFYEVGFRLATKAGTYNDQYGIDRISKYAKSFGLGEKTGIEIPESSPKLATKFPVMAAIGQSDHAYTTAQLARYVTSVANSGTVYNLTLLDKTVDGKNQVIKDYSPVVKNKITNITSESWNAIHNGMRMVVEKLPVFNSLSTLVAGKTGTAQEDKTRPTHALFVGYAPFDNPSFAIATRIAFGYTSGNAAELSAQITKYYFKEADRQSLVTGEAGVISSGTIHD